MLLSGCSGSSDRSDSNGTGDALTCAPKELRVRGQIDDVPVDLEETTTGYSFENKVLEPPGSLRAPFATGRLELEFDKLTPNGGSSTARGFLRETDMGLSVGNCDTGAFVSSLSISDDGTTIHFTLRQLAHEPYCSGSAAKGELTGCFAFEKR